MPKSGKTRNIGSLRRGKPAPGHNGFKFTKPLPDKAAKGGPRFKGEIVPKRRGVKPEKTNRQKLGSKLRKDIWNRNAPKNHMDLWADDPAVVAIEEAEVDTKVTGLSRSGVITTKDRFPEELSRKRPRKYSPGYSSKRRAVELPHAGLSYNPDKKTHEEAQEITAKALEKYIAADEKYSRKIAIDPAVQRMHTNEATDKGWSEDELVSEVVEPRKKNRKTPVQRNRAKAHDRREAKKRAQFRLDRKDKQIDKIEEILDRRIAENELNDKLEAVKKEIKGVTDGLKVDKLGGTKYYFKPMPVLAPGEVKKNLRQQSMNHAGTNPLVDRQDSYMQRNMLQVRKKYEKKLGRTGPAPKFDYVRAK